MYGQWCILFGLLLFLPMDSPLTHNVVYVIFCIDCMNLLQYQQYTVYESATIPTVQSVWTCCNTNSTAL